MDPIKIIKLKPVIHREQECIGIYFEKDEKINGAIRKYAGAKWSTTKKVWWIPLSKENYNRLFFALKGKAEIEQSELRNYLSEKKKKTQPATSKVGSGVSLTNSKAFSPVSINKNQVAVLLNNKGAIYKSGKIHEVNAQVLPKMEEHLKLKSYSSSTRRTYLQEMTQLLLTLKNIPADDLKPEHMKRYLVYCHEQLRLKENTLHSRINAMKFYYEQVLGREKFFWEIPRPKKQLILPKVLGEDEVAKLFNALGNLKHKAMLFTAYSAGLRVSEIVNLKL